MLMRCIPLKKDYLPQYLSGTCHRKNVTGSFIKYVLYQQSCMEEQCTE